MKYHIHCVYVCYIHIIEHFIRCILRERETKWGGGGVTQQLKKHSRSSVIVIDLAFAELKSTRDEEDS